MSTKAEKITFKNENEVKKWLRSFPVIKKELDMRITFYDGLANDFSKSGKWKKEEKYYRDKIMNIKKAVDTYLSEYERLLSMLDESERLVLTAKYLKAMRWDNMEMYIYYSRRQAIRIRDKAVRKLIGQHAEVLKWQNNPIT